MSKRKPPPDYYDEPEDWDADEPYAADEGAYDAYDAAGDYESYGENDDVQYYDDEYVEGDPFGDRYEVAPDDVVPDFEVYDEVYQRANARAEKKLDRPRRQRRAAPEPPAPGRLRLFVARHRSLLLKAVVIGSVLTLFVYFWLSSATDNEFSAQAPSIAPPVVRCGDASGGWPQDVAISGHTIPALIKNSLSWPGERHGYQFSGIAGQVWRITAEARGGSALDPLIRLFDQSGREVATVDDRSEQDFTAELTFTLPESGAYCVLVESAQGGMTTGPYWLSAWMVE